jgi:two-component system, LytTR family, response regulator LytT
MKAFKILIVEDEILIAEDLKDNLVSFGCTNIEMAHNKTEAIDAIQTFNPDLVLLDVRMENEKDGIEIGEFIAKNFQKPFIYITAHSDVNMIKEIVKTKPAGYITKPVKKSDLFAAITLATEQVNPKESNTFKIKDGYSTVIIPVASIIYIESEGNYVNIYCDKKKHVSRQSLDSVITELDPAVFFRIHRSYLINTSKIKRYSKKEVELDNITLPVSRNVGDDLETFISRQK